MTLLRSTLVLAAFAAALVAHAAPIVWSAAQNVSGDADVIKNGSVVAAYRLGLTGLTAATVNGVTFQPFAFAENANGNTKIGDVTINPGVSTSTNTACGTTSGTYGGLSAATRNLLQSGTFAQINALSLTLGGLKVGTAYTFRYWVNNAGNFTTYGYQIVRSYAGTSATGAFGQAVANTSGAASTVGGVGQFVTGTFTADATNQSLFFRSTNDLVILNAFQLVGPAAPVPEPASMAALGLGVLGLLKRRRRA